VKVVLFLCTGNYYRSRFAEEMFNLGRWRASALALPAASRRAPDLSLTFQIGGFLLSRRGGIGLPS
jgi:protein-tyrosine phosphatase